MLGKMVHVEGVAFTLCRAPRLLRGADFGERNSGMVRSVEIEGSGITG